jgi:hypothetical protein
MKGNIKDIVDDKIKTHVDAHVNPLIETVNKQQKTITDTEFIRPLILVMMFLLSF